MEIRQIQYFLSLYEEGSMTKAANRLNVVQPAISMQLAKLEDELGQQLFLRNSKGMDPTPAGQQMYKLFRPLMGEFARARAMMRQADGIVGGHVASGLIGSVAQDLLAQALMDFTQSYPRVTLALSDGYTPALCKAVTEGTLDAAIINKPRRRLSLNSLTVLTEDFVLATGLTHPPLEATIPLREVQNLKLVLPTRLHGLRDILDSVTQAEDIELTPALEVDSISTQLQLVEVSDYAALLPRIAVRSRELAGTLRLHAIRDPALIREVVCVTHPRRILSLAAAAFIDVLKRQAKINATRARPEVS